MTQNINSKLIVNNKKAAFEYFILDRIEAGIVLTGPEVKSIRQGKCSIKESYAVIRGGEAFLRGMHINPYKEGNRFNVDPDRTRKLLLHKKEIDRLQARIEQEGLTLVPTKVYLQAGLVKVELGLGKGKKLYDKRESLKKRQADREISRALY